MSGEWLVFIVLSIFMLGGATLMLSLSKVVHMVVAIALSFLSVAGFFFLLEAEFIAVAQILVYGGAVTIIMLFGIMLTRHDAQDESRRFGHKFITLVGITGFLIITVYAIDQGVTEAGWPQQQASMFEDNTAQLGVQLFAKYVIPFELTSIVLLVALVGAIILSKREDDPLDQDASPDGPTSNVSKEGETDV